MRSYWKYSKANICRHREKIIGNLVVTKELSGKTSKTICLTKEKYLTTNQALAKRDGKAFHHPVAKGQFVEFYKKLA